MGRSFGGEKGQLAAESAETIVDAITNRPEKALELIQKSLEITQNVIDWVDLLNNEDSKDSKE